jgi:hypothetical protein
MSGRNYYQLCCRYQGRVVRINDRFGKIHHGRIVRVSNSKVYIQPLLRRPGFGYGYYGYGGYGAAYGVALGAIVGVALAAAFFW